MNNLGDLIGGGGGEPDRVALVDLGLADLAGARPAFPALRQFTYAELDRMAAAVAGKLATLGHARGDRIALLGANSGEYLVAYAGIVRAGLVAVPINFKLPAAAISRIIEDSGSRLVFCDAARAPALPAGQARVILDSTEPELGFAAFLDFTPAPSVEPHDGELAMFLYTSGSSGHPKGVMLSHAAHLWVARTRAAAGNFADQRLLVAAPLYHMNALGVTLFAFAAGATIVLMPQFQAAAYIEAIERCRCTFLTSVPSMIAMMLRETPQVAEADLSSVRAIRMGSAPVSRALMAQVRQHFPSAAITNAYATTEAGPIVFGPHPQGLATPELSLGCRHPGVELKLVAGSGAMRGQSLDGAAEGVLHIRSPALMTGYHALPEATRRAFDADGFYITGDILRRDADGFYYFVGRGDDMFVSGGENIFPGEIERMLERHGAIEQAVVLGVPDDVKGTKPVAFVVTRSGYRLAEEDVKAHALANGPAYAHPRRVWLLDKLPLAGTNKIDRQQLYQLATADIARRPL